MNSTTETDRPPWEIPIRERPAAPPEPPPSGGSGRWLAALILLGVACLVATAALIGWMFDGGDDGAVEAPTPTTSPPITFAPRDDAPTRPEVDAEPEPEPEPTTTTTEPTTTTEAPTTTTPPTTAAPAAGGTGSVPALTTSFGGGWVAQLTSVPYSAGTARLEAAYAEVRSFAPGARAARAEDWSSLNDGFWVLVEPGPFASAQAARDFCARVDRSRSDCTARELRRP